MKKTIAPCSRRIVAIAITFLSVLLSARAQNISAAASGYAPANGSKLYYEIYGEGKPVILLHGAFMTIDLNWRDIIPGLAKNHKVIAIELQGHGHTPLVDRKLSFPALASDVESVMDNLKIDSADMVGYSMGGTVAYQFAIQSPKRLKKLVIISSTYKSSGWLPSVTTQFKAMKPEYLAYTPLKGAYEAVAPDKTKWMDFLTQMVAFVQTTFDLGDANITKIAAPVLIISGDNDGLDKVELMKTYQALGGGIVADMGPMPKSQLAIIPGQSHVSVMMQSAAIVSYVNGFLQ